MGIATEKLRFRGALLVILVGLAVISFLAYSLPVGQGKWQPSDVIALVGALTTAGRDKAEGLATRALAALPPEAAREVIAEEGVGTAT